MKLSLTDLAKIVLACAVAAACITPGHRAAEFRGYPGLGTVIGIDAIIVPLVWALFVFLFVPSGPRRVPWVEALILAAVTVALGFAPQRFATFFTPRVRRLGWRGTWWLIGAEELIVAGVVVGLILLAPFLAFRLARRAWGCIARRRSAG